MTFRTILRFREYRVWKYADRIPLPPCLYLSSSSSSSNTSDFFFFFFTIRGHGNFRPIWGIFLLRAIAPINRARISRIYSDVYYTEFWLNVTVLRAFSNSISCTKLLYEKKTQKKKTYIPNSNLFQQTQLDIRFSVPRHEISAWYYSCFDNNAK